MPHNNQLQTLRTEIEQAREELNDLIGLDRKNISNKKVVELSQILDNLLVEYLKEQTNKVGSCFPTLFVSRQILNPLPIRLLIPLQTLFYLVYKH